MNTQKMSISLPQSLFDFVLFYQRTYHIKSRSEVVGKALSHLQQEALEAEYRAASEEIDEAWECTNLDGLDANETW